MAFDIVFEKNRWVTKDVTVHLPLKYKQGRRSSCVHVY